MKPCSGDTSLDQGFFQRSPRRNAGLPKGSLLFGEGAIVTYPDPLPKPH
ncbi:hypothetical protein [Fibrella forsythiae]|uniref:Uncharacterized protein n=1 Tax=Fibrella forsythiae TaxID=2817061 RepID=A0ABS3JP37_9BACT|nr:hypothetical protein [Fibrella forsythiae]MBO0951753.1 hypothetical protein [Fibrella forsythiae]